VRVLVTGHKGFIGAVMVPLLLDAADLGPDLRWKAR
jgi:nucleoside-diphosphate-sugar epimerase